MAVKTGNKVKVEYTGKLADGTVFDKSEAGKPLEFTVGEGRIIPGFEKAVEGMNEGEGKTFNIPPDDAYGTRDESLIRKFSKASVPKDFRPEKGMVIQLFLPGGESVPATIIGETPDELVVDLNHPLAGKDLTFDVKVVGTEER